jgi:hypothetical protein
MKVMWISCSPVEELAGSTPHKLDRAVAARTLRQSDGVPDPGLRAHAENEVLRAPGDKSLLSLGAQRSLDLLLGVDQPAMSHST